MHACRSTLEDPTQRIAFVGSVDAAHPQFAERFEGYRETLARHGLAVREPIGGEGDDRVEGGRRAVAALLAEADPPDAIFAANDAIALGALEALDRAGARVPDDFGVVGFDGLAAGVHSHPPLTTVEPDFAEAGRLLVAHVCGEEDAARRVPVSLIERGSVRSA